MTWSVLKNSSSSEVEQALRRIDGRDSTTARDHERHGHQRTGVEFEDVVGRVVDHSDACAAVDTVLVDDARTDQLVNPQGVVARRRRAVRPSRIELVNFSAAVRSSTPSKRTSQRCCCCARLDDRQPLRSSQQPGPRCNPFDTIGDQRDVHLAANPVGATDAPDFAQVRQSTKSTSTSTPSRVAAARTTVRMLCAVRPRRPITRPRSPGPTLTSSFRRFLPSTASTRHGVGIVDDRAHDVGQHGSRRRRRNLVDRRRAATAEPARRSWLDRAPGWSVAGWSVTWPPGQR